MSTNPSKLVQMEALRFDPDPKVIADLEDLLARAKKGEIRALGTVTECLDEDTGMRAADWCLVGATQWPVALLGAIMMLTDEAKNAVRKKLEIDANS